MKVTNNQCRPDQMIHAYDFSRVKILNKTKTFRNDWDETSLTILGARQANPEKSLQMTITNRQLEGYSHAGRIKTYLRENDFTCVSAHKNPNSNAVVYTLMAPSIKDKVLPRDKQDKTNYTNLYAKRSFTYLGASMHGGGCCGVSTMVGFNAFLGYRELEKHKTEFLGSIFRQHAMGVLFQFILGEKEWNDDVRYYLPRSGFKSLYNWTNPNSHEKFHLIGWSANSQPVPSDLF